MSVDSKTVLLLHCNGSDGATSFPDSSPSGHTASANGNAQVDTAQSFFGGASALLDGAGDFLSVPDSADFAFASGDFTIDFRVRFNAFPADGQNCDLFAQGDGSSNLRLYLNNSSGNYILYFVVAGTTISAASNNLTLALNTWYHFALVRSGNSFMMFQDGTQVNTTHTNASAMPDCSYSLYIGKSYEGLSQNYVDGWMDEIRVSKGIARWTANFSPPVSEYGGSASFIFLS